MFCTVFMYAYLKQELKFRQKHVEIWETKKAVSDK